MKTEAAHVLVFDSGVGGLSIVKHLREMMPTISLTYIADTLFFPYGLMKDEDLVTRVVDLLVEAAGNHQPDVIVVACNSASTLVLPTLRARLTIPIVGVVPAIKPAAQISASKVIGLLATPGTIRRDYTDELIGEFAPQCEVIRVGSSQLVQLAEDTLRGIKHPLSEFSDVLAPLRLHPSWQTLDTVVLACTHFPLVSEQLAAAAPQIRHWVDSGDAIARRVKHLLRDNRKQNSFVRPNLALCTSNGHDITAMRTAFDAFGFADIETYPRQRQ